jgi:hypothetical protein
VAGWTHGETVTRLRPGTTSDPYSGGTVEDWSTPAELAIENVAVEPATVSSTQTRNAVTEARQAISDGFVLYLPPGAPELAARDHVRVRGTVQRVVGTPAAWRNPFTGWEPGTVVTTERTTD